MRDAEEILIKIEKNVQVAAGKKHLQCSFWTLVETLPLGV